MSETELLNLEFSKALTNVVKKMRRKEDEYLKKYSLSHFHSMYLMLLAKKELTMSELTDYIGVDKANTSRAVNDLLEKGYIEKATDAGRKFTLKLTKSGKKIAQDFKKRIDILMEEALASFSERERANLHKILKKLLAGINDACEKL